MNSIGTKLLLLIGFLAVIFSSFLLFRTYQISNSYTKELVGQQADLALQFDLSIREYVANEIRPAMYELLGEEEFIPETMSTSYIARAIFEDVQEEFPDFILKFSSDNPRNPANQAGPEELEIIKFFNANPDKKLWFGNITINEKLYYAKFNARRMEQPCLRCHGKPEDAPKSLIERYGASAGFNRPIGEVVALDTIAIPHSKISLYLEKELKKNLAMIGIALSLFLFSLFIVLKNQIGSRIAKISRHFSDAASIENLSDIQPIYMTGKDEIAVLAESFNALAAKLGRYHDSLESEIATRKQIEDKLLRSRNTLQSVLDSSIPICITGLNHELIQANKAYYELWPNFESGTKPLKCYEVRPGSYCHTDDCPLQQIKSGKETVTLKSGKDTRNGRREFIITARPFLDLDGQLLGIVESFQDVTEWRKAEDEKTNLEMQLRQSQKMESIGTLAGGIAHDFNNILAAIYGYAELGMISSKDQQLLHGYFTEIEKAGARAKGLVQQILTFSRQSEKKKGPVDINLLVKEVLKLIRASTPTTIEIKSDIEKECGRIFADPIQMHQLLMNLCTNAIHALKNEVGTIEINLDCVELGQETVQDRLNLKAGKYIRIEVKDSGEGIEESIIDKIFDPYFTTKKIGQGTGLGLSVVHGIVKDHNGDITVASKVGYGTTFRVLLPEMESEGEPVQLEPRKALPKGSERLLIVDDEYSVALSEKKMLEALGYKVRTETGGKEALDHFKANREKYDLIITDQTMPGMTGYELAQQILAIAPGVPIILCTGYSSRIDEETAKSAGIRKYVSKPFSLWEIATIIREVLDERYHQDGSHS